MLGVLALVASVGSQIAGAVSGVRAAAANRRAANRTARDILDRAEFDVMRYEQGLAQLEGQQIVGAAAQGIDPNFGSAATIRAQAQAIGAEDIAQIRLNAEREAWGIRTQARNAERAARNQLLATGVGLAAMAAPTLLNRAPDAWRNWQGGRTLNAAARRGTFTDPSWF